MIKNLNGRRLEEDGNVPIFGGQGIMANMQTECLNVKCSNPVSGGEKWCTMDCKKQFLLDNYSPDATIRAMRETQESFKIGQKEVMKKIKESGMGVSEYILGLGAFNDVPQEKSD